MSPRVIMIILDVAMRGKGVRVLFSKLSAGKERQ